MSLSRLQRSHWALLTSAMLVSLAAGRPGIGGLLLGGGVMGLSLYAYAVGVRVLVNRARPRLAIGVLFVKLLAFLGLGWFVFTSGVDSRPDPLGFAVGVTCFPAAAVWEAIRARES